MLLSTLTDETSRKEKGDQNHSLVGNCNLKTLQRKGGKTHMVRQVQHGPQRLIRERRE